MKKALKTMVAMFLALALALTCVPQTAEAASKITVVSPGKSKNVQTKLYKGAGKHTAKVTFNEMSYVGQSRGLNVYHVAITVKNTKITQAEANGLSMEYRKKYFSNWYSTALVLTDSKGNDITGTKAAISQDYYQCIDSGTYKKTSNYSRGYLRYRDTFNYPRTRKYSFYLVVPAYETDVYVGIAGLKNGQPTSSKSIQYRYGNITFKQAGFGGKKQNIVAVKVQ
ncbi:hypothetical protein [Butyrivibrio sp. WCD3002]|uniref:hypothetical protein n=1 Tax=Butyrivibrio sp. WCD3002 TaxID=1280676 RepID=UPI000407EBD0|nr:hypothetical protein [Butyrivibrio sp. WCD3002]